MAELVAKSVTGGQENVVLVSPGARSNPTLDIIIDATPDNVTTGDHVPIFIGGAFSGQKIIEFLGISRDGVRPTKTSKFQTLANAGFDVVNPAGARDHLSRYFNEVPTMIAAIKMRTGDTSNFTGSLTYLEQTPDGMIRQTDIQLDTFRKESGEGVSDVLVIDQALLMTPRTAIILNYVKKGSDMKISCLLTAYQNSYGLSPFLGS